jgi:hypothetical protein
LRRRAAVRPVAGALGDRLDRRRVLIASGLLGAACSAAMALVSAPRALLGLASVAALQWRLAAGMRLVLSNPTLRALTLGFVLVDFGNGLVLPADVALAHLFGTGSVGYGLLVALWGGGVSGGGVLPDRRRALVRAGARRAIRGRS